MPSRPTPMSFLLLISIGLLAAGVIALAGFAIDKGGEKDTSPARTGANEAAAELAREGLFPLTEDDPARALLEGATAEEAAAPDSSEQADEAAAPAAGGAALLASGDPARGREIFFANGCSICHGENGEGLIGPTIASTRLTVDEVITQYRTPRLLMPPVSAEAVPDADVAHVWAWLQTLDLPDTIIPGLGTP